MDAYPRASTVAKTNSDGSGVANWKTRLVAWGVAVRPDLVALAATSDLEDRKRMKEVVEAALETAQASSAARTGTAIHSATELVDGGAPLSSIPVSVRESVAAYQNLIGSAGLRPVDSECFVVNEELHAAGTFDRLYRLPDGRTIIGDLKTGSAESPKFASGEWAIQPAIYATAQRCDLNTGRRSPISVDLDPTLGVIVHVPARGGEPALYALDLVWGLEGARLANRVRAFRRTTFHRPFELNPAHTNHMEGDHDRAHPNLLSRGTDPAAAAANGPGSPITRPGWPRTGP